MITISLCMIVKNEEEILSRCLDSVADLVDEIIVVDTGSLDRTKEIAARYTPNIYSFPWIDDFAAARNFSFSKAVMDYCMWLDADDVLQEPEREKFLQLKQSLNPDTDVVMMKYNTSFDASGNTVFCYFRERWVRNSSNYRWIGEVHEVIPPSGKVVHSDIAISHKKLGEGNPDRNLDIYRKMIAEKKVLDVRQQYYYGRELYYHGLYKEAVEAFNSFFGMPDGWVENKIEACTLCADCYYKLDQDNLALKTLLQSLTYDLPRAEICCEIGKHFLEKEDYRISAYWYETALNVEKNVCSDGFILPDCYDYIPSLQLCVCCDRMGDREKAEEFNEKAGSCKPDSEAYLYNKNYFESLRAE